MTSHKKPSINHKSVERFENEGGTTGAGELSRKKRPRDANQLAKSIVDIATGEADDCELTPDEQGKDMINFDYAAPAELFAAHGRAGLRYRRFSKAAEAIRYAVEKLPGEAQRTTSIEVDDERYDARQIRALYENKGYPLARK
jgi:hypothetical protein